MVHAAWDEEHIARGERVGAERSEELLGRRDLEEAVAAAQRKFELQRQAKLRFVAALPAHVQAALRRERERQPRAQLEMWTTMAELGAVAGQPAKVPIMDIV